MKHTTNNIDMYRVVGARLFSRAGSEAAFFVGVWGKAAFVFGATAAQLAGIMFVLSIASIVGSLVAGVLVDRFGPRRVLVTAEFLFIPAALGMALTENLTQLALMVGVWAFAGAPVVTAAASFAPFLLTEGDRLERINAWIEGAGSLAFAIGPAIGALLVRYASVDWVFVFDAGTSLLAALMVARVHLHRPADTGEHKEKRHPLQEVTAGLKIVYTQRNLRFYILAGMVVWVAFGSFGALEPLFFRDVVGTGIESMSWMNSIFGVGFVLGATLLPRLPRNIISARGLVISMGLVGMGTVLYVGSSDLRVIAVGALAWSMFIGVMVPLLKTLLQRDAPNELIGRVMSTAEVHHRVGELLPLAIAPGLAALFGVQKVLIGGGLAATLAAVLAFGKAKTIDRETPVLDPDEVDIATISASDEPISPNP